MFIKFNILTKLDLIKKIASSTGLERGEVSVVIENLMFEHATSPRANKQF